ncbi:cyclic-phosphate processing receiver domain-containing protein [Pseudopelagicola sp. nBUS_20]|uniref:cyclic-phosphate processing receiver domain-containing protein n=1 Tax=Pseudopelagicola sp. nBUS_20 TaxID=3395317 RepID=UPI003EBCB048
MTYALFIDDERDPPNDGRPWRIARTLRQVDQTLSEYGAPVYISFDHDLGEHEPTGYDIVKAMVEGDMGERPNSGFETGLHHKLNFYVHSQNPIGKENIEGLLTNYLRHKRC